jgi:hypothetical protein
MTRRQHGSRPMRATPPSAPNGSRSLSTIATPNPRVNDLLPSIVPDPSFAVTVADGSVALLAALAADLRYRAGAEGNGTLARLALRAHDLAVAADALAAEVWAQECARRAVEEARP